MFSLAKAIFDIIVLRFNISSSETKTIVLVEAILEEEKLYPKPVESEVNF